MSFFFLELYNENGYKSIRFRDAVFLALEAQEKAIDVIKQGCYSIIKCQQIQKVFRCYHQH